MDESKWPELIGFACACLFGVVLARGWPFTSDTSWEAAAAIGTLLAVAVALGAALRESRLRRSEELKRRDFAYAATAVRLISLAGAVGNSLTAAQTIIDYGPLPFVVESLDEALQRAHLAIKDDAGLPLRDLPQDMAQDTLSAFVSIGDAQAAFNLSKKYFFDEGRAVPGDFRARVIASNLRHAQTLLRRIAKDCRSRLIHPLSVPPDMQELVDEANRGVKSAFRRTEADSPH